MSIYSKIIDLQKLRMAWKHVKKNNPASGVDNITCSQFDHNSESELKKLVIELAEHKYQCLPVKVVNLYKGEKTRQIALYTMRDKVVQQSIAIELNKIYDHRFLESVYAYRADHSALEAVDRITDEIKSLRYHYALKLDITHFFDEIRWDTLEQILRRAIAEDDTIDLIHQNTCGRMLDEITGELIEKARGIYQGSSIAPVLSNVYLMEFDQWISNQDVYYVRYADDILILGLDKDALSKILQECSIRLQSIGLRLNESKSILKSIEEGIDFLGYHFDLSGKSIPVKAEQNLQERLETMWLTNVSLSIEEKIKKALEIIGGWEQYFRGERDIHSIFEYIVLVEVSVSEKDNLEKLCELRYKVDNVYSDIFRYLVEYWQSKNVKEMELLEYEQFYQVPSSRHENKTADNLIEEVLTTYRKYSIEQTSELATELMQSYTDINEYESASFWQEQSLKLQSTEKVTAIPKLIAANDREIGWSQHTPGKFLKTFAGREDIFEKETLGYGNKRLQELQSMPLTERSIKEHFLGNQCIDTFIQRPNATVKYIIFDVDVSKKILLQYSRDSEEFTQYLTKALNKAAELCKILDDLGLKGYIEFSGNRGYHVWLFFMEWMQVRYANLLNDVIEQKLPQDNDISLEFFPNKTKLKNGKFGQVIKLPYGMHLYTGKRSYFLDERFEPVMDIDSMIDSIAMFSVSAVKTVISRNSGVREVSEIKTVDQDISVFGDIDTNIAEVLGKCNLMRFLCQKAYKTGYLPHFERLSILYVFGHLGDKGKDFVHKVMSYTLNYSFNVTERFIRKCPEKPVSCTKLQDQYKKVTAEIGCNCIFKKAKNCYPSPVLHAIILSDDVHAGITLPTSRTYTKEKEQTVLEEINIHKSAQSLAKQILELKKEKRQLDKKIAAAEQGLSVIFDNEKIEQLELEMGLLTRRKSASGYEWLIEI